MFKKMTILSTSLFLGMVTASLVASTNINNSKLKSEIKDYVSSSIPPKYNISVKVDKVMDIKEKKGIKLVKFSLYLDKEHKKVQTAMVLTDGSFVYPDLIDLKTKKSLIKKYESQFLAKSVLPVFKNEKKANYIEIGHNPKNPTVLVFTDPFCPFCKRELELLPQKLKTTNFKFIFTPVHGLKSYQRAALIKDLIKPNMSDNEKYKIFKKYFNPLLQTKQKPKSETVAQTKKVAKKYFDLGVRATPTIIKLPSNAISAISVN